MVAAAAEPNVINAAMVLNSGRKASMCVRQMYGPTYIGCMCMYECPAVAAAAAATLAVVRIALDVYGNCARHCKPLLGPCCFNSLPLQPWLPLRPL